MKYLLTAAILLFALAGCRPVNRGMTPHLLLIDCRNQKIRPLTEKEISSGDPLVPAVILPPEMPDTAQ